MNLSLGGGEGKRRTLTEEVIDAGHAFAETVDRFPNDTRLREAGFKIAHRPNGKEPLWEKNGVLYAQCIALTTLPAQEQPANARRRRR